MSKELLVASLLLLMTASTAASAQDTTPPRSVREEVHAVQLRTEPAANTVTAIIVKSWGDNPVWDDLNANWAIYGTIPVSIDHTTLINGDFTYADLVNSNADVIILSDPAGGNQTYSSDEVAAIRKYVEAGHSILGTYVTFQLGNTDNRALAPIFGFSPTLTYNYVAISNQFIKVVGACLFRNISDGFSKGYPFSQVPSSGVWTGNLGMAKAGAESDSYVGVVTGFHRKNGTAIYISNMPEYQTIGGDDEQFLYNAITCYAPNR